MHLGKRVLSHLSIALFLLFGQSSGEIKVVVTTGFDIELTEAEEIALA